jgi:hypothetical protein
MSKKLSVFIMLILGVIFSLALLFQNWSSPILWRRVRIPETRLSVQIPLGYEYLDGISLLIMEEIDTVNFLPSYPLFYVSAKKFTDAYRTFQAPEDVLANVFKTDFEEPQWRNIQGVDVYLGRYTGDPSQEEIPVVKALLFYDNQYITFDAVGLSEETEMLYTMTEAMLNSLLVEEE